MTQLPTNGAVVTTPQPNVFTVLLIVAILVMLVGIIMVTYKLTGEYGYGLSFGELFQPFKGVAP